MYPVGRAFSIVAEATNAPITLDILARKTSRTSGFFFCGIILLVNAYSSGSSTMPNSILLQTMRSSAILVASTAMIENTPKVSSRKSLDETASKEFSRTPLKPSNSATLPRSIGKLVVAKAPAPIGQKLTRL